MIKTIVKLLEREKIEQYLINEEITECRELYFIKKRLDLKRSRSTSKRTVKIYREDMRDGKHILGSADVLIFDSMSEEEIVAKLREGYFAASVVCDEYYPLAECSEADARTDAVTEQISLEDALSEYSKALFASDTDTQAYINSAEIFCSRTEYRTVNSRGVDVYCSEIRCDGEIVVSCKSVEDVEMYDAFSYTGTNTDALSAKVSKLLSEVKDRSVAVRCSVSGNYDLIIEGSAVRDLLEYYLWRANAKNIYTKYSECAIGEVLMPKESAVDITACATLPYSSEGVRMHDTPLVRDGKAVGYVGSVRFCSYLGTEPTGEYEKLCVGLGEKTLAELKTTPHLHVVSFSDFQFDPLDGYFGGEIRLAYLFDGVCTKAVTGLSISSNASKLKQGFEVSREQYENYNYNGPLAIKLKDVCIG